MTRWLWVGGVVLVSCASPRGAEGTSAQPAPAPVAPEVQALIERAKGPFAPLSPPPSTPLTAREQLGRRLFFETKLSTDGKVSCGTCHQPSLYGTDGLAKSVGVMGKGNPRNAPTVFNATLQPFQHWRADRESLEDQAARSLLGPASFGNSKPEEVLQRLAADPHYPAQFREAFPGEAEPLTIKNLATAVGDFQRRLLTPARFDAFLNGQADALSAEERAGLQTFMDLGCVGCHSGPGVGGQLLQRFGLLKPYWEATGSEKVDRGRADVDGQAASEYVFKVASLRNVAKTPPYFHDGSVAQLDRAVRVMGEVQLGKQLTDAQAAQLVAFLGSLTGEVPAIFSPPGE